MQIQRMMSVKSIVVGIALLLAGRASAAPQDATSGSKPNAPAANPSPSGVAALPMTGEEAARQERIRWWRDARFGMFIHWGLYSIPAGVWKEHVHPTGYSEWIMFDEKIPAKEYELLAGRFNPVKFDAKAWAAIAKQAGMKYMVLTAKHHDGFSMFHSALTPYNIAEATPFKRDVTRELSDACRASGIRFGCYYSVDRDWYRPLGPGNHYEQNNLWDYADSKPGDFDRYLDTFARPQVEELLTKYQPDVLWFDGIDMMNDAQVGTMYQAIRRLRPDCVVNSRIKTCAFPRQIPPPCCDYISTGDNEIAEKVLGFEWENPGTLNTSYGYNQNDTNWVDAQEVIARLVEIVSKGGNYLLNVGPTSEGLIPQASVERLKEVGAWMDTNGEAIYGTMPWRVQHDTVLKGRSQSPKGREQGNDPSPVDIRFTARNNTVYAICLGWPGRDVRLRALGREGAGAQGIQAVRMLGSSEQIQWQQSAAGLTLSVPKKKPGQYAYVYRIDLK